MLSARTPPSRTRFEAAATSATRTCGSGSSRLRPRAATPSVLMSAPRSGSRVVRRQVLAECLVDLSGGQAEIAQLVVVRAAMPGLVLIGPLLHLRACHIARLDAHLL